VTKGPYPVDDISLAGCRCFSPSRRRNRSGGTRPSWREESWNGWSRSRPQWLGGNCFWNRLENVAVTLWNARHSTWAIRAGVLEDPIDPDQPPVLASGICHSAHFVFIGTPGFIRHVHADAFTSNSSRDTRTSSTLFVTSQNRLARRCGTGLFKPTYLAPSCRGTLSVIFASSRTRTGGQSGVAPPTATNAGSQKSAEVLTRGVPGSGLCEQLILFF